MRRNILISLVCLASSLISGQTLTLQLGGSFSNLNWKNSIVKEMQFEQRIIGFNAQAGIEYLDHKYFNLSSNFGFIQKGGKDSILFVSVQNPEGTLEEVKITLDYLTLNTTIEGKIPIKEFAFPFLHIGPRIDYLIAYKEGAIILKQFEDLGELNKFTFGIIAGGGINFKIKKILLGVLFDYYLNLNKLVNYTANTGVINKIADNTFTLNLKFGYSL